MADADKELLDLGAQPHDDELKALGAVSTEDKDKVAKYISKPEVSELEAARAGLANGGTFGFAPRIGAVGGALASAAQQRLSGEPQPQSIKDLYNEYLKYNNERQQKAQEAHPVVYGGAQLAGGIASPMNKIGAVGAGMEGAPIVSKMAQSALAGGKLGAIAGASQSPDLGDIPQTAVNAAQGAAMGGALGAAIPPLGAAMKGAAGGVASTLRPLIGQPGTMFGKGMQAGIEGAPNLAGEPGQLAAVHNRNDFANQFVKDVHDVLSSNAKNKRELISSALAKSQLAPAEAVQAVTQKYLEANPQLNEESARKELDQLKEMFITAAEGPKKTVIQREYNEGAKPPPIAQPGSQFLPPQNGPAEVLPPEPPPAPPQAPMPGIDVTPPSPPQLSSSQGGPGPTQAAPPLEATAPGYSLPQETPEAPQAPATQSVLSGEPESANNFGGYEAVHKATIDADDEEARAAFQQKIHEKLADEKALGQNSNDNPVQVDEQPIPGTDKVRLVAKRAIENEDKDAFKDQAAQVAQKQREDQRLQQMLDQQNELKLKMQQQQDAELLKPQYKDIAVETREGGRNLRNPEELYNLQKNLQAKSQFSEGRGFSSQEMNKMSGDAARDIAQLIKATIPETVPVDERLNAFNNVAESLGIDTDKLKLPGGEGQKARQDAMKKVLGILSPETPTDKSQLNQSTIDYVQNQLNRVHPDIGQAFADTAAKHAEDAGTIAKLTKPETVGGGGPILSSIRRGINKIAYNTGHAAGSEVSKMEPGITQANKIFQQYTPDALQRAGAAASKSTNQAVQQMGQVLSKLATADDRTRNSMMFVLQQQAGYRDMMAPYFEPQKQTPATAANKSLEKYK
jgi:hypothetical protein